MGEVKTPVRDALYGLDYDPYKDFNCTYQFNSDGWASDSPEFTQVIEAVRPNLILEVGSWYGKSARHMVDLTRDRGIPCEVVCIDTWLGSVEHWVNKNLQFWCCHPTIFQQFMTNVIHMGMQKYITPFPCDSINAAYTLKRLNIMADLIYIDAGHEYENVSADVRLYLPLLRSGGIMLLDDSHYEPIKQVANEQLRGHRTQGTKIIWTKP